MKFRCRKLALLLVFLALPLQGAAATIHALSCLSEGGDQHAAHSQTHGHDHESPASPHHHEDDAGTGNFAHYCCNLVASGLLGVPAAAVQAEPPALESPIPLLATLFIPEQPRRPPRS
jgi:hypothetical protein